MTDLVSLITPQDDIKVKQACSELFFRSIVFVYLIINKPKLSDNHWIYIPGRFFLSNRISEFKNFNEDCAPPKKTIICSEVTCFCGDRIWNMNNERLADRVTEDLVQLGLIGENEVEDYFTYRMKHAYPIYDIYYREHLDVIRNFLNRFENLYSFGRNALFRYNNMDHSVEMGLAVAESVIKGEKANLETATQKKWFG
jgi:protoporphyrinogen oxidase